MELIFFIGLFLLPFVFWPWAVIPYEIPRVWFFQRWVEILGILGIWQFLREKKLSRDKNKDVFLILAVFIFSVVVMVSAALGVDFGKSFWGNYYRGDGLLTFFHLLGLFFFLILFGKKEWLRKMTMVLAGSAGLLSVWTLFLGLRMWILGGLPVSSWLWGGYKFDKAIGATFGQPNFLAGYLLVTLPFWGHWWEKSAKARKLFLLVAISVQVGAIILTFSRAAVLGLVLAFFAWQVWGKLRFNRRIIIFALIFTLFFLFIAFLIWKPGQANWVFPESRTRIIVRGLLAATSRPFLGWGWANFDYAFEAIDWPVKFAGDVYIDKAHSTFLEVLVTSGILGFLVYLAIVGRVIKNLWLSGEKIFLLVFLLWLFHSQTNVMSIAEEYIFWIIAGMAANKNVVGLREKW